MTSARRANFLMADSPPSDDQLSARLALGHVSAAVPHGPRRQRDRQETTGIRLRPCACPAWRRCVADFKMQICVLPSAGAPDNLVAAALGGSIGREEQHEDIGSVESVDMKPHAAFGNVSNQTEVLRTAVGELDRCQTPKAMSRRPASLLRLGRFHDPRLQ